MSRSIWIEPGAALNPALPLSRSEMTPLLEHLLRVFGLEGASLEVRFVDDSLIEHLNREFLGLPGPTNVLSFPADDPKNPGFLGELALSVDAVAREAALYGQDLADHLIRLLAHGVLHLTGHDHGEVMEEMTDMAVEALR